MAYAAGTKITVHRSDRLFDILNDIVILNDAIWCGLLAAHNDSLPPLPVPPARDLARIQCSQFPVIVALPGNGPFRSAPTTGWNEERIEIDFLPEDAPPNYPEGAKEMETTAFRSMFALIFNAALVIFYERHRPQIEVKFTKDEGQWPTLFRFARHMRNAASHHEGVLNLRPRNPPLGPITWHHLSYSPADNGKRVLWSASGLGAGDIICLLLEMAEEFDRLCFS